MQLVFAKLTQLASQSEAQQRGSTAHTVVQHAALSHPGVACGVRHDDVVGHWARAALAAQSSVAAANARKNWLVKRRGILLRRYATKERNAWVSG